MCYRVCPELVPGVVGPDVGKSSIALVRSRTGHSAKVPHARGQLGAC